MSGSITILNSRVVRWRERLLGLRYSRRIRKIALIFGILLVLYSLFGFFAVPALLQHWVDTRAAGLLGRPVSVGALRFNPFTLKLGMDQLHIGETDGRAPFVDVDQLTLNGSWTSLFHLAPVLDELIVQHPQITIRRGAAQGFNFSDLIDRAASAPAKPDVEPARFSLSNISVHAGDIHFDDQFLNASHHVENIEIGIPFLANLPHETELFVQPLLAMSIDGRPLRIEGQTKPFADSLESILTFHLDRLDLPQYLRYAPSELPVTITRGVISGDLQLRFVQDKKAPRLDLSGLLLIDDFALTDKSRVPIAEGLRAIVVPSDVQPLISRYRFSAIQLNQVALHYVAQAGGHSNFDALLGNGKPAASKVAPTEVTITGIALEASRFEYIDSTLPTPATMTIEALAGTITGLNTLAGPAAEVDINAKLNGGSLASRGKLDIPANRYTGSLNAKDIGLAPLQPFAAPSINAMVQQGRFDTNGSFFADWHGAVNLHIEPAQLSLRDVAIGTRDRKDPLIAWKAVDIALARFDLAASEARQSAIVVRGLVLNAQRGRDGKFDLASLGDGAVASASVKHPPSAKAANPAPTWRWSIDSFALDDGAINMKDQSARKPTQFAISAIKAHVDGLSDDLHQALKLALSGSVGTGHFDIDGKLQPAPLSADLKVKTSDLDLTDMQPYVEVPLNVSLAQAQLSSDGQLRYTAGSPIRLDYRGRASLGRVRVRDKLSGDDFLRWRSLSLGGIDLKLGEGPMKLTLGDIALSDFYARVIMNADGHLNLSNVAGSGAAAPVSVTRADDASNAPTAATSKPVPPPGVPASTIQVGTISLAQGHLNYTDNFIKPNYTANITQLAGKISAFGSVGGAPAQIDLQGQLDDNAPVTIEGKVNPLAPVAYLDIKGKASGVELTHLSAYSSKYTGYPIEKGRLNADVSYLLDQGKLKADNHLFIDQLTFGDEIKDPGVSHLPVKLAVALLKNSRGEIDVNVPVSGSLDDPQFSIGGMVWRALGGLIAKAATSPFRLIASAFNSGGGGGEDLGYIEYAAGADQLDQAAKTKLSQIAKVLVDRPTLNLGIIGRTDPSVDEAGLRVVLVDELIRQEYHSDHDKDDTPASTPLSPEDTERYLKAAYKHATFAKEHNLIGLTASQPPEEMRRLLEANIPVDESAMLHLAERRAGHVVGFLHGKVEDRRLFVLAPKLDAKGIDDQGKTTRVDFGLQ